MIKKPTIYFVISLALFIVFFPKGKYIPTMDTFLDQSLDWITSMGIVLSSIFALLSIIGFRRVDNKKTWERLIITGNIVILTCGVLIVLFFLILNSGFPPQD